MSPFITYKDADSSGELQYYILQREYPHYVGIVYTHKKDTLIPSIQVTGYYLWIVFDGSLRGKIIPGYRAIQDEIFQTINSMADWFYQYRIIPEEKKYKKFKYDNISS